MQSLKKKNQIQILCSRMKTHERKRVRFVLYGPRERDHYLWLEVTLGRTKN